MSQELFTLFAVFIALFLFGMTVMRIGLSNLGYDKLKDTLVQFTDSPIKGVLVGTVVTAILQSSSAVMVITVGFVAVGLLTFKQSIGIILGTNIGTVVTLEILTFDMSSIVLYLLLFGVFLLFLNKHITYCLGCVSFGLGCIFIAMQGLEGLALPLSSIPSAYHFFELTNESQIIGVGIGTVVSALIQSSTATTAIAMGFMDENILNLPSGIAIMFGANIGTCFTAWLASVGANHSAKLVAYAHIWLNIIGVIIFFPFIGLLSELSMKLTVFPAMQLAHASLIFNVLCSLLVLPFVHYFSKFVMYMHKTKVS